MEFLLLGPLEVRRDGQPVEVRGSKRRALLALLVLHANEVVRTERLIDELWGERPPANAPAALQNHVSRLRKDLGGDVLATKPWGYVLRADPETIDARRFEAALAAARPLPARERRAELADALALWRGSALADVAREPALASEAERLEELRLSALEQRIDADLELGGDPELVAELESLVARHPVRERLRGQLILALYRGGRQAEALETFRETRRVLVDELGIEPSAELRELERAILRQDPALAVAPAASETTPPEADERRFRWPRSPLVLAAAALLMAAGGTGAAILVSGDGGPSTVAAAPPTSQPSTTTTQAETASTSTAEPEELPRKKQPKPPPATTSEGPTTTRTTTREPPPEEPPPATVVRTEPAKTTKTTTTTITERQPAQQKPWVYWLEDDFEDPGFDFLMWRATNSEAITTVERNGRLEFSIDPRAVPQTGSFGADYSTQCTLSGDFDARVEFQLLTWPPRNGLTVFLSPAFRGETPWTFVARKGAPPAGPEPERYTTGIYGYVPPEVPTADTSGALRLTRVGRYMTTYYRYRGTWVRFGSAHAAGIVRLVISVASDAAGFGYQPAVVAFDNFRATAVDKPYSVECEGVPYPPHRPPP